MNAGSPVASVYRINSVLKMVCSNTATPTTQSSDRPWRTNVAGPSRNSPLPIDTPSTMIPGPTACSHPRPRGVGGTGRSAGVQGSSPDCASGERDRDVDEIAKRGLMVLDYGHVAARSGAGTRAQYGGGGARAVRARVLRLARGDPRGLRRPLPLLPDALPPVDERIWRQLAHGLSERRHQPVGPPVR